MGLAVWEIDRDLLVRALLILALEPCVINLLWAPGVLLLQVLYALGTSMICMVVLRRTPDVLLVILALGALIVGEWTPTGALPVAPRFDPVVLGLFVNAAWIPYAWKATRA